MLNILSQTVDRYLTSFTGGSSDRTYPDPDEVTDAILQFDTDSLEWTKVGDLNVARYDHAMSVVNVSDVQEYCHLHTNGSTYAWLIYLFAQNIPKYMIKKMTNIFTTKSYIFTSLHIQNISDYLELDLCVQNEFKNYRKI